MLNNVGKRLSKQLHQRATVSKSVYSSWGRGWGVGGAISRVRHTSLVVEANFLISCSMPA